MELFKASALATGCVVLFLEYNLLLIGVEPVWLDRLIILKGRCVVERALEELPALHVHQWRDGIVIQVLRVGSLVERTIGHRHHLLDNKHSNFFAFVSILWRS